MNASPIQVTVERLSQLGEGVAPYQGRSLFIRGALPGERVQVRVSEEGRVLRGELLEILQASSERRPSFCAVSDRCGGCDWIHLSPRAQALAKQEIVLSSLERLGGISRGRLTLLPTIWGDDRLQRRRAVMHWAAGGFGFFARGTHDLFSVDECPALVAPLCHLPAELKARLSGIGKELAAVHLLARDAQVSVALMLKSGIRDKVRSVCAEWVRTGGVFGVVASPKRGPVELFGHPVLRSPAPKAEGIWVYERPDLFSQAGTGASAALVETVLALGEPKAQDKILELYSGNGSFTFALATRANQVTAVESNAAALSLARRSAGEAGRLATRFIQGDAAKVCEGLSAEGVTFDWVVADPPRTGARGVGIWAERLRARAVVYVACDPASFSRDAKELEQRGFRLQKVQVLDLFPFTHHVEAVGLFARDF